MRSLTRRKFIYGLFGVGLLAASASLPGLYGWYKRKVFPRHVNLGPGSDSLSSRTLKEIFTLLGVIFARPLDATDEQELTACLDLLVKHDQGWEEEFNELANHLRKEAGAQGTESFSQLQFAQQSIIVENLMRPISDHYVARLGRLVSSDYSRMRLIKGYTLPRLFRIYQTSGVPWRARGYNSWPGIPGDPREYTRPGTILSC